jgi:glycosyltransferase involved in cell wall biosynthesis
MSSVETLLVSVVIPCRNEARTVAGCVRQAQLGLARLGVSCEVIVVDNASTDDTAARARQHGARVVTVPTVGYGSALAAGIASAGGRYVVMADGDGSYDLSTLGAYCSRLAAGADLVVGNRFRGGIEPHAMPFLNRVLGNPVLSWLGRTLFPVTVGDFHCGMRAFRREAVLDLRLSSTGMEFASEMIVRAAQAGLVIDEVPTFLSRDGRAGHSHLRPVRDGLRHVRLMARAW